MNAAEESDVKMAGPSGGAKLSVGEEGDIVISTSDSFAQKFAATLVKSNATWAGDVVVCLCHQLLTSLGFYVEGAENSGDLPADWKKTAPFYYSIVYRHTASDVRLKLMFCQVAFEGPQTFQVVGYCTKGDSVFTQATIVSSDSIRVSVLSELNSKESNFHAARFFGALLGDGLFENVKAQLLDPIFHRALGLLQSHGGAAAIGISTSDSFAQKFRATLVKSKATDAGDVVACLCHHLLASRGFYVEGAENCGDLPADWKKAAPFYYSVAYRHPESDVRLRLTLCQIANGGQSQTFRVIGCCTKGDCIFIQNSDDVSSGSVRVSVLSELNSMQSNFDAARFFSALFGDGLVENVKAQLLDPISHLALGLLQSHGPGEASTSSGAGPKPLGQPVAAIDSHFHQIDQASASSTKSSNKSINQCNAVVRVPAIKTCKMPKKRRLSCPINDLADEVLLRILKLLPLRERLLASEVCKRWNGLSRIPWHDVTHLELADIPEKSTRPIVALCPNLQTVLADGEWFAVNELQVLMGRNLSSVRLLDCVASIPEPDYDDDFDILSGVFSNDLASASWEELVLHDLRVVVQNNEYGGCARASSLPASLKRLQLCGIDVTNSQLHSVHMNGRSRFLCDIGHLQNLTCLILTSTYSNILLDYILEEEDYFLRELQTLKSLRELCFGFMDRPAFPVGFLFNLPSLAVLFLHNINVEEEEEEEFGRLVTKHPSLRILAITGPFPHELFVPERRLYPSGFGSTPVPKLHIFVGKEPSEKILFTKSSEDALKIHPITEDLPSFLAKEEIAPIFDGVWIAAQIKESREQCQSMFFDGKDVPTSFHVADDV